MATSIKLSELTRLQHASLTDTDLFLITDQETNASMALTYKVLREKLLTNLQQTVAALQSEVNDNAIEFAESIGVLTNQVIDNDVAAFEALGAEQITREQAVAALQALIDALQTEAASRNTRIEALEADPTTKTYVDEQISALIDGAPGVLNTLNELATALGGDDNLAVTISNSIATVQASLDALALVVDTKASSDALTAEQTRASAAEASLQANIDAEATARDAAVTAEQIRAIDAEASLQASLQANIDAEATARDAAVTAEVTRATDAEAALQSNIDTLSAQSQATDTSLTAQINAEVSRATGVEGTLRTDLDAEIDARTAGDTALDTRLTSLEGVVDGLDIDISPETLNSINELAAAIGDDADFIGTINTSIAAVQADVDQNEADADAALAAEEAARLLRQQREDEATIMLISAFDGEKLAVLDLTVG